MAYNPKALPVQAGGTGLITTTQNKLLYSSANNVLAEVATVPNGILATNASGVPAVTTASGNWNNTTRSAFLAYVNTTIAAVTGDGTNYSIVFGTKSFDQGTDFNAATGVATAPKTGLYHYMGSVRINGLTSLCTAVQLVLATSSSAYVGAECNPFAMREQLSGGNNLVLNFSFFVPMTAADTAKINLMVSGAATKVVGVFGSGASYSSFGGYLVA